ncbi:MAG: DEAD/DEAH box helicase [Pedobacter sp.]
MTQPTTPATLPPLLKRFHTYQPNDIYAAAAKVHLMAGFEECKSNKLTNAIWNEDKTSLIVSFTDGFQTTLLLEGYRLLTKCDCHQWQPARNCPHVVVVWATLKRMVSPETLSYIQFNRQLLLDMKRFTDKEPGCENDAVADSEANEKIRQKGLLEERRLLNKELNRKKARSQFCLVIEAGQHGSSIIGRIKRGNDVILGWNVIGIPTDLARFLSTHYYYESTSRYFEAFLKMTKGAYPIVFLNAEADETSLVYCNDEPRIASITFDIRGDEIHISRSLDNGMLIPAGAVLHGQLLFNPETGTIHPISNRTAWKTWEAVIKELDPVTALYEFDEFESEDDYYFDRNEPVLHPPELKRLPHTVVAPISLFNAASIRLIPEMINDADGHCYFLRDGLNMGTPGSGALSYLLDIPHGMTTHKVSLTPVGVYDDQTFAFSNDAFWLLNPFQRSRLSVPMKAKKRVKAILETAFVLLDETKPTARNTIIRSLTNSPDFLKLEIKRNAKQLLNHLSEEWNRKMSLLMVGSDGWHCVEDNRRSQARLIRILFEIFGMDAFCGGLTPCELELPTAHLLKKLPQLMERLQQEGFSLRVGRAPMAMASWEFSLDATKSSIDWFELRPEIRCNGELLSDEEMSGLFNGTGMLRRDGKLMLLDEISAQVLAMFTGAMPSKKRKRKGEQEPVRVPRLQILDWLQLRNHGVTVKLNQDDARVLESLLNFDHIPERPVPASLNATLRHYQADAWRWLAFLYEHRFGACLADDMGLGKTLQGITLLAGIMLGEIASCAPKGAPHLVVVPPSLLFNWEGEIARFLPTARVLLYTGSGRSSEAFGDHDIVITSYGIVQRDIEQLEKLRFDVIIFDETQVVKNLQASTSNAVRKLKGSFAMALTGTPVENHLGEYYAIMDLCLPGLLGSREEFTRQTGQVNQAGIERLIRRTRPFILRRSKQMIAAELPPKIETDIQLELSPKQKALYQRTVEEVRGQVSEAFARHASGQARIIALTAILRLRQICLAPALASPGASDSSPKLDFLAEQLLELRDEGHSVLVFSQFTGYLDIIEQGLKHHGLGALRLDGSTPVPQRRKLVQAFQNSEGPAIFLVSLKAGGKGLNLTRATYVYHMDPWWNPAVENQASDRAHRIGQTEQVTITRLIMRHTIEEKMMTLKEQKLKLYKAILEEGTSGGGAGLSRDDFEFLLGGTLP